MSGLLVLKWVIKDYGLFLLEYRKPQLHYNPGEKEDIADHITSKFLSHMVG